jgi:ABC-type phosphate transport system auxiliary subunit
MKQTLTIIAIMTICAAFTAAAPWTAYAAEAETFNIGNLGNTNISKEQFKALPDTAVLEVQGRRMTKAQINSELKSLRLKNRRAASPGNLQAVQAKFHKEWLAEINADDAKVKARLANLRQNAAKINSIQQETLQLNNRFRTASPAEKQQMEKRAEELLRQLKQLGYEQ